MGLHPRRFAIACIAAVAGVALSTVPARAQQFTMKFSTQTLNDLQHEFMKVYKTELEQATNGRIQVGVYPASQLGGQQRQTEGLRLGTIEAAVGPGELFAGADPRFGGLERFPLSVNRGDSLRGANKILWPSRTEGACDGLFE